MMYGRHFRILVVLVAGMIVGTVLYRNALQPDKFYKQISTLSRRTQPHEPSAVQKDNQPVLLERKRPTVRLDNPPRDIVPDLLNHPKIERHEEVVMNIENDGKKGRKMNEDNSRSNEKEEKTPMKYRNNEEKHAENSEKEKKNEEKIRDNVEKESEEEKDVSSTDKMQINEKEKVKTDEKVKSKTKTTTFSEHSRDENKVPSTTIKPAVNITTNVSENTDKFLVPAIVHYAWYSTTKLNFRFHHFISVLSAYKHIKPEKIMFWYEIEPKGPWWVEINKRAPIIELKYRKAPTEIYGKRIRVAEHQSDIVRLEAVMEYGGIYTDLDVVVTKSFDPLRKYPTTMGYETVGGLCNGIIISAPHAPFLQIWHETYKSFDDNQWAYHSVQLPAQLAKQHADLIHTEQDTLHRPNWIEKDWLYKEGKIWDWSKNYAVHLWYRFHNKDHTPEDIKTIDTTMGQLFRYTYYGSKELIKT